MRCAQWDHVLAERGTLVVVVPAANGVVVASDLRSTVGGKFFDGREKLHVVNTFAPIVFAFTGAPDFANPPPAGAELEDWVPRVSYAFRASDLVRSFLEGRRDFVLTDLSLRDVAVYVLAGARDFLGRRPQALNIFLGRELCRLALCQADAGGSASLYGSAVLKVELNGDIVLSQAQFTRYLPTDEMDFQLIGEARYVTRFVFDGPGRCFLTAEAQSLLKANVMIGQFQADEADRLATAIIDAAERTSALIPIPSGHGIGGGVRRLLLTATEAVLLPESRTEES